MTKHVIVAIKDTAARTFGRFFAVPHGNVAIRNFNDEVNRPGGDQPNDLYSHPDDYELYELGAYDDSSGQLLPYDAPRLLVRGKDLSQRTDVKPTPFLELSGGPDAKSVVM